MNLQDPNGDPHSAIFRLRVTGFIPSAADTHTDTVEKRGLKDLQATMREISGMNCGEDTLAHLNLRSQTRNDDPMRRAAMLVLQDALTPMRNHLARAENIMRGLDRMSSLHEQESEIEDLRSLMLSEAFGLGETESGARMRAMRSRADVCLNSKSILKCYRMLQAVLKRMERAASRRRGE